MSTIRKRAESTQPLVSALVKKDSSSDNWNVEADDSVEIYEEYNMFDLVKDNWKTVAAGIILLSVGLGFFMVAFFSFYIGDWWYGSPALVAALICLLPGGNPFIK